MPKKTRFGGWQCSDCTEKEEEETTSPNKSDGEQSPESSIDTPNKRRRLRENVKGPNKFVPDAETTPTAAIPKKKKRGRKRKRIKGVRRNKIKIKKGNFSLNLISHTITNQRHFLVVLNYRRR